MKTVRLILFALLLCCVGVSFADTGYSSGISVAPNDYSIQFLGYIFGQVGDVIPGQGNSLLGIMFKQFNYGITVLAILIFGYIYGKGIIDTASEGQFLGKKVNSVWVPLRGVFGLLLLVPSSYSGYNIAQVGSMWVLKQGIGIADQVWNKAVIYLTANRASTLNAAGDIYSASAQNAYKEVVNNIFQAMVCESAAAKTWPGGQAENSELLYPLSSQKKVVVGYHFKYNRPPGGGSVDCGSVNWKSVIYDSSANINTNNVNSNDADGSELNILYQNIIYNIMGTFIPIANYYVDQGYISTDPPTPPSKMIYPKTLTDAGLNVYNYAGSNFIYEATQMFMNQLEFYKQMEIQDTNPYTVPDPYLPYGGFDTYAQKGWIMAGAYWYQFKSRKGSNSPLPADVAKFTDSTEKSPYVTTPVKASGTYATNVYDSFSAAESDSDSGRFKSLIIGYGITLTTATAIATAALYVAAPVVVPVGAGLAVVLIAGTSVMAAIAGDQSGATDPIFLLGVLGHIMLVTAAAMWAAIIIVTFFVMVPASVMSCMNPLANTYSMTTTYIATMGFGMVAAFFGVGALLAIYLPMLPYLYFTLGAIHYFLVVFELMIIIVIGVLGLMMPEGQHDLWGMAQQAVFFLVSAFLRPVMMVFGLMAAGLIVNVAVRLINAGFYDAMMGTPSGGGTLYNPVEALLYLFLYTGLCITACTIPFKLINRVPDAAMHGINFTGSRVDVEQDFGMTKKGSEGAAQGMGAATKEAGGSASKDTASLSEKLGRASKAGADNSGQNPENKS